ncbi:MAG: zinc-ribbon domain-containing protein [Candidatus Sedimenticola sp. 20ELBAFRAG]
MDEKICNHCGFERPEDDSDCPNCGAPSPSAKGDTQKRFLIFFAVLIIFCLSAAFLLPR